MTPTIDEMRANLAALEQCAAVVRAAIAVAEAPVFDAAVWLDEAEIREDCTRLFRGKEDLICHIEPYGFSVDDRIALGEEIARRINAARGQGERKEMDNASS